MTSLTLTYRPAPAAPRAGAGRPDLDDAIYDLAEAGATAEVALDGYRLPLTGTGVMELVRGCRSLAAILDGGVGAPGDEELRAAVPQAPPDAVLHQWLFSSYMVELPVLIFAVAPESTWIATRTLAETDGWPLVALEGRDLAEPVAVPTAEVDSAVRGFLAACEADARSLVSGRLASPPDRPPAS